MVSSSSVKSLERFVCAQGALESWLTSCDVLRAKSLSTCWKRPFFMNCVAMAFAEMGHFKGAVDLPANLLMVCQALWLEWVKSMDSTVSVHSRLICLLELKPLFPLILLFWLLCVCAGVLRTHCPSAVCSSFLDPAGCVAW